jgi:hypothetical protein
MMRPATLILFALAVIAGGVLFTIAFEVSALEDRLGVLNEQITEDRDAIHVLRAEWGYLNQPERLGGLSQRYLELHPLDGSQLSDISALPARPVPAPSTDSAPTNTSPADTPPATVALSETESPSVETPIAATLAAKPKLKPAAPRRPSRHVRLASQNSSPKATTGAASSDKEALDAALRAIFGNTTRNAGGTSQ